MHIKTVILLGNFFHLVCVMLICQQRFLFNVFLFFTFFIKNAFFNVFYSWGQRFLHLWAYLTVSTFNILSCPVAMCARLMMSYMSSMCVCSKLGHWQDLLTSSLVFQDHHTAKLQISLKYNMA